MKDLLISTLSGKKGRLISIATGAAVGLLTKFFTDHNWQMDPAIEDLVATAVGMGVGWAIDAVILWINTSGIQEIQNALPPEVKPDGYAGPKTVEAVQDAVDQAKL